MIQQIHTNVLCKMHVLYSISAYCLPWQNWSNHWIHTWISISEEVLIFASSVIAKKNVFQKEGLNGEKKAQVSAVYMRWGCFVPCWRCLVCSHWQDVLPSLAVGQQLLAKMVHQPALSWWLLPAFGTINVFLFWSRVGECLCSIVQFSNNSVS